MSATDSDSDTNNDTLVPEALRMREQVQQEHGLTDGIPEAGNITPPDVDLDHLAYALNYSQRRWRSVRDACLDALRLAGSPWSTNGRNFSDDFLSSVGENAAPLVEMMSTLECVIDLTELRNAQDAHDLNSLRRHIDDFKQMKDSGGCQVEHILSVLDGYVRQREESRPDLV